MTWLPPTQKPPKGCVLVATPYEDFPVWLGYFEDGTWYAPDATEIDVKGWQPLPEAMK